MGDNGDTPAYWPCSEEQFMALTAAFRGDESTATVLCKNLKMEDPDVAGLKYGVNSMWLVLCGALVFLMHGGFAMLCAGAIRHKNTLNILMQTILDAVSSALSFYIVGFGFAYGEGESPNKFIGDALFALARYKSHNSGNGNGVWTDFFFQWAFVATATTIPAGCVAERFNFFAYLGYSIMVSAFVYPVVVHWVWCRHGWLTASPIGTALLDTGMVDFAGSGVVHMVGGLTGMMGAILVGPRLGRFDSEGKPRDMPGHSPLLVVLGTCLLWFGWYGFNPGSTLIIDNMISGDVAGRAAVTTTLSGAAGGITCMVVTFFLSGHWDVVQLCNGVLCGFVSITAGAHVLEPWAAIMCGACGALIFLFMCWVFLKLNIDDPLSAAPMHGFTGAWGVIYVGLLAKEEYMHQSYPTNSYGLFYGGGGKLLGCQIIGVLVIATWVCGTMGIFFAILKYFGKLRISHDDELMGLDASKHGQTSPDDAMIKVTSKSNVNQIVPEVNQFPVALAEGLTATSFSSSHGTSKSNSDEAMVKVNSKSNDNRIVPEINQSPAATAEDGTATPLSTTPESNRIAPVEAWV